MNYCALFRGLTTPFASHFSRCSDSLSINKSAFCRRVSQQQQQTYRSGGTTASERSSELVARTQNPKSEMAAERKSLSRLSVGHCALFICDIQERCVVLRPSKSQPSLMPEGSLTAYAKRRRILYRGSAVPSRSLHHRRGVFGWPMRPGFAR
jgi:hypothetical protein